MRLRVIHKRLQHSCHKWAKPKERPHSAQPRSSLTAHGPLGEIDRHRCALFGRMLSLVDFSRIFICCIILASPLKNACWRFLHTFFVISVVKIEQDCKTTTNFSFTYQQFYWKRKCGEIISTNAKRNNNGTMYSYAKHEVIADFHKLL